LFVAADSDPADPSAVEAGFEMQLSHGQHEQYGSQFQDSAPPAITGTRINRYIILPFQLYSGLVHHIQKEKITHYVESSVLYDTIPCCPLKVNQYFGKTCHLPSSGSNNRSSKKQA
jgi:hypothetical protein